VETRVQITVLRMATRACSTKLVDSVSRRHVRQVRLAASYAFDVQFYASYKIKASHS